MNTDIRIIWNGVLAGNPKAWRQLVSIYAPLVYSVARRTGLTRHDAEDCAQQTWMNLYRRRRSIKDPTALPAWLIRATHRKAITLISEAMTRARVDVHGDLPQRSSLPDKIVEELEELAILDAAMRLLDERCRRVLSHLYLTAERASYQQLARDLRIKPNSLGPLRSRCIGRLRKILKDLGWQAD